MGGRKTEILSFSVPPGTKREYKELAEEQGMLREQDAVEGILDGDPARFRYSARAG